MKVGILALTSSNYNSIGRALNWLGAECIFIKNPTQINQISHLILPGVSNFKSVMGELHDRGLVTPLEKLKMQGLPILGLCAGMQVMGSHSEESPGVEGLNWFDFKVESVVPNKNLNVRTFHTGWNQVQCELVSEHIDLSGVYYFNHSFYVRKLSDDYKIGISYYGEKFTSVIKKDNVTGAQFHPEKSQTAGLKFLEKFIKS
jgi:glutamine amidotransferase